MTAKEVEILISENKWDQIASVGDKAVPTLTEELKAGDDYTRYRSAKLLGEMKVYQPLVEALSDPNYDVRRISANYLKDAGDSSARLYGRLFFAEYDYDRRAVRRSYCRPLFFEHDECALRGADRLHV